MRKVLLTAWLITLLGGGALAAAYGPQTLNLPADGVAVGDDEEKPDVTARVARISFIRGDVQVKRSGSDEWEKAVLNLPMIEGDEIATGPDARVEMQFNNYIHLRLAGDALLKLAVMKDEGVAVSLTQGTMSLHVTDLEKAGGYIEADAPKTTVAIEKSGSYRIDAGKPGDTELHVAVAGGGTARVYSENAGFTLKSGRGARVFLDGDNAGEWETAEAAKFGDEFDNWAADRDVTIADRIKNAHYNKYYDQDIYGADDLNDNGDWIYTSSYGYVWRPFPASINAYANWTPYRYGHWRWLGPYGWTWVNDEPWGWATYHYGRWVYDNGYWVWCPYSYYRPKHSWWFPALVSITIINNNVCWYPLSYRHHWRNFNGHGHGNDHTPDGGIDPTKRDPRHGGIRVLPGTDTSRRSAPPKPDPKQKEIPLTGVVTVAMADFGIKVRGARGATTEMARAVLENGDTDTADLPPARRLPSEDSEIAVRKPVLDVTARRVPTGAATRSGDGPLDQDLRTKRILGDREPVKRVESDDSGKTERTIGAVDRPAKPKPDTERTVKPVERPTDRSPKIVDPERTERRPPVVIDRAPPPAHTDERPREQPRPSQDSKPKSEPPARTPPTRSDPPSKAPEKPKDVERKVEAKDGR